MKRALVGDRVELTQTSGHVVRGTVVEIVGEAWQFHDKRLKEPRLRKVRAARVYWDKDCLTSEMKKRRKEFGPDLGIAVPIRDLREVFGVGDGKA